MTAAARQISFARTNQSAPLLEWVNDAYRCQIDEPAVCIRLAKFDAKLIAAARGRVLGQWQQYAELSDQYRTR